MNPWIRKLFKNSTPRVFKHTEHPIKVSDISHEAMRVISTLNLKNHEAYIVGGAVRDLLLGRKPKDFDIATNASPEDVRRLFKRSRIVGKRFPIVHVVFGHHDVIEVTTFRANSSNKVSQEGRIMRDNQYGSRAEDSARRDFTCNALYFDPIGGILIDDHNGWADIRARRLVMIGNPTVRFREDPMRILRAARLSAKLHFSIDDELSAAMKNHANLLENEPIARLFDEISKELLSGYAQECLMQWRRYELPLGLHPVLRGLADDSNQLIARVLHNTDQRVQEKQPVALGFVLAALLWDDVRKIWSTNRAEGMKTGLALVQAVHQILERENKVQWGVPQRFAGMMRDILNFQSLFETARSKRALRFLGHIHFRAAYDFLQLRALCDDVDPEVLTWWQNFVKAEPDERLQIIDNQKQKPNAHKKRKRAKKTQSVVPS